MILIKAGPDTRGKLNILSEDSRYDLACACAPRDDEHRRRSRDGKWIYPVSLPSGQTTFLFKTLLSNECVNNCKYCPLRAGQKARRCGLTPEELSRAFLSYYRAGRVSGLFLSSAVKDNPDNTMERINRTALILRREQFKGYIHLKIIPGSSEAAIRQSVALATAVSLNVEAPGEDNFKRLSTSKDYLRDIIRPMQIISRLGRENPCGRRIKQTTQFVVGASNETDKEIIDFSWKLYRELGLSRAYFSAYQRGTGSADLPGEHSSLTNGELLTREHRLYQVDWLIRKYGFRAEEIPVDSMGNLALELDPKEAWAKLHPEFFPVEINKDDKYRLLRVPGLGQIMVERILSLRQDGVRIRSLDNLGKCNRVMGRAKGYVTF
ncbi:MAG: radical SAM protein [Candidatus Omnitrophica bacterium]|jgi:predicted DNA-binding helix-hairpin-helix protein|nr:radical SAM protein [Candidatus Omnitrophota bacterium]